MSWQFWALGSAIFAALTAITAKVGVKDVDSNLATAIRVVVIGIFAWGIAYATGVIPSIKNIPSRSWWFLAFSGMATGASWLCYFRALQLGPASKVAPLDKMSVVFAVLGAAILLGEPMNPRMVAGLVLLGVGVWLLAT